MFDVSREVSVRILRIGRENQPLLIVDKVLAAPQEMIDYAADAEFYVPPHTHYPGTNANVPEAYYRTVINLLRQPLEAAFGVSRHGYLNYFGFLGLSTLRAADATSAQRVPHVDSYDPNRLAMVHYLCSEAYGGTGFFRHRASGFESVDHGRAKTYVDSVMAERAHADLQRPAFPTETMPLYDLIGKSDAVFNRLIVYRSHVFHAPLLGEGGASPDPRQGRLTANGFVTPVSPGV